MPWFREWDVKRKQALTLGSDSEARGQSVQSEWIVTDDQPLWQRVWEEAVRGERVSMRWCLETGSPPGLHDGARHQPCIPVEMSSSSCRWSEGADWERWSRPPPSVSVEEFHPPGWQLQKAFSASEGCPALLGVALAAASCAFLLLPPDQPPWRLSPLSPANSPPGPLRPLSLCAEDQVFSAPCTLCSRSV